MLISYIRNKDGSPRGCVVAIFDEVSNDIFLGWSLCCKRDNFNKKTGVMIAKGRALSTALSPGRKTEIPCLLINSLQMMLARAKKYFKVEVTDEDN